MLGFYVLGGLQSKEVTADEWGVSCAPGTARSISVPSWAAALEDRLSSPAPLTDGKTEMS